jgi:hypothetical protein
LLLPITVQLLRCRFKAGKLCIASACQAVYRRKTDVLFQHRLVRLQNQQACVSDLRLSQFSMICQGTRSLNLLANADYTIFHYFVNSRQTTLP